MAMGKHYKPAVRRACWLVLYCYVVIYRSQPYRREGVFSSQPPVPTIRRHRDRLGGCRYDPLKGYTA